MEMKEKNKKLHPWDLLNDRCDSFWWCGEIFYLTFENEESNSWKGSFVRKAVFEAVPERLQLLFRVYIISIVGCFIVSF